MHMKRKVTLSPRRRFLCKLVAVETGFKALAFWRSCRAGLLPTFGCHVQRLDPFLGIPMLGMLAPRQPKIGRALAREPVRRSLALLALFYFVPAARCSHSTACVSWFGP